MSYEEILLNHKSVRDFEKKPVDCELVKKLIRCGQHAPTSEFIQSYSVINVSDPKLREAIYDDVTSQKVVLDAPVFLIFLADVSRLLLAGELNHSEVPEHYLQSTETFLMASVDTAIMAQTVAIAAEMEGLGCTFIGGIRNNPEKVIQMLHVPKGAFPLFGLVMGYPKGKKQEEVKPRLPLEEIYNENSYDTSGRVGLLDDYDTAVRKYYIRRTNGKRNETWIQQMAAFITEDQRPNLKKAIAKQGFELK